MTPLVVSLFAGAGGGCLGARAVGLDPVGFELDPVVCATRAAAGLLTIRADVAAFPTAHLAGRVAGILGSPPCQAFSAAGKGAGQRDMDLVQRAAYVLACGLDIGYLRGEAEDPRSLLVLEPLRWVRDTRPWWVALEQVPPVLELWQRYAEAFQGWGYSTWTGVLCAANYGVPQTRERAILMASLDHRRVHPPEPTHSDQRRGGSLFGLQSWVSMAQALGWGWEDSPARTVCGHRGPRWGYEAGETTGRVVVRTNQRTGWVATNSGNDDAHDYERTLDRPAPSVTGRADRWTLVMGNQPNSTVRTVDEPAPTVLFGARCNDVRWIHERPATTVLGTNRVGRPGHKDREAGEAQYDRDAVRITVEQAAVLQGMPADYPFQGTKTQRFQQVGDAFPPPVAAAVIGALTGGDR